MLVFVLFLIDLSSANLSPNYFCADMSPQQHILIDQIMGMWYGVEILTHSVEEEHYVTVVPSCPVIHISRDNSQNHPYNPLHPDYNYNYNYGERRDNFNQNFGDNRDRVTQKPREKNQNHYRNRQQNYNRGDNYNIDNNNYNYNNDRYGTNRNNRKLYGEEKGLRIYWDENGEPSEYVVHYNETKPGFWFSSGIHNGSDLEPMYSHFAGTIQVIKAVGNHMVLTFCHQLPGRQLFTVILSRENKLDPVDIHSVHELLNRKDLSTRAIKKVCANASPKTYFVGWLFTLLSSLSLIR